MTYLPSEVAAITGKPPAARIYARWLHVGAGLPLLAAALLVAVTGARLRQERGQVPRWCT